MNFPDKAQRERFCLGALQVGTTLFITSFLWAPSRDVLDLVFHLFFALPLLLLVPWRSVASMQRGGWKAVMQSCGGRFTALALLYAAFAVTSNLWSEGGATDIGFFLWQLFVLAGWLCGVSWLFRQQTPDLQRWYRQLLIVGLLLGVSTVGLFYSSHAFSERLFGWSVVRNEVVIGQTFGALALLAYVLSLQADRSRSALWYLLAAVALLVPVALSQSRWPMAAFLIMALTALLVVRPRFSTLLMHAPIYLGLAAVALQFDLGQFIATRGMSFRDVIWPEVWQLALDQPLLGSGYVRDDHLQLSAGMFHHPHNAWLDIFYRTGLIGLTLTLLHLGTVFATWRKHKELLPLYLWLCFGCLCFLTDSRVLFWELNTKWFLYWIPAGLISASVLTTRQQHVLNRTV